MKNKVNVVIVPIEKVKPNSWNPNRQSDFMYEKEIESIKEHGFLTPPMVRELPDGFYEIIDGEHRWRAASELGMKEIPVNNQGDVSEQTASILTVILNEIRGKAESGLMADLMSKLEETVGREELERLLPFTSMEFDNMLNTANLGLDLLSGKAQSSLEDDEGFRTVSFNLPEGVADQLEAQVKRFKVWLNPNDNPKDISPVQAIEAMCQTLSQTEI